MNFKDYTLVWEDDFNYTGAPDDTKWGYEVGNHQWPNNELQAYTNRPSNVFVQDGILTIKAIKEQDGERQYTSSKLVTRGLASWKYGYFEIKAKLPRGLGSWPAIWMMPVVERPVMPDWVPRLENGRIDWESLTESDREKLPKIPDEIKWPNCGEIDIIEHIGRLENSLLFSLHSKRHNHRRKDTKQYTTVIKMDTELCSDFHTYAMEWTEDYIEYFVDGESYCRYNKADDIEDQSHDSWPFDKPFYLIMNIAVGGGLGGPVDESALPYEFEIDYVKVWQKNKN